MKITQLSNLKMSLVKLKFEFNKRIDSINRVLKEIEDIENNNEKRCPNCFGRDLRVMVKGNMFCRNCGYDSRDKRKVRKWK